MMEKNQVKEQKLVVQKQDAELSKTITQRQVTQFQFLKEKAAKQDSTETGIKLENIKALEKKQRDSLKHEQKKLYKISSEFKAKKKEVLKEKIEKVKNIATAAAKYTKAGIGIAGALTNLSYPVDALKIMASSNQEISSPQGIDIEKEKLKLNHKGDKILKDAQKVAKQQNLEKKSNDKDQVEKLLKERELDIKKGMAIEGKKVGASTRVADKKLLEKLNKGNPLNSDEKASREDFQNAVKAELQKSFGDDGRKAYENKLQEEVRKREAAQKDFYQKSNQDIIKKR